MRLTVESRDGTKIAVHRTGSGPGVVWVDAAGAFGGMRPMDEAAGLLADSRTVLTFDRRGRGESGDASTYDVEREVHDVLAVVAAAPQPVTLFGFSSGAALALHAAAAGAELERVVLLEPPLDLDAEPDRAFVDHIRELVAQDRRAEAIDAWNLGVGVPDEWVEEMHRSPVWPHLEALAHTYLYDAAVLEALSRPRLARVSAPVLVLASSGSGEELGRMAREVAAAVPHGTFRELAGEWHGLPVDVLAAQISDG